MKEQEREAKMLCEGLVLLELPPTLTSQACVGAGARAPCASAAQRAVLCRGEGGVCVEVHEVFVEMKP